MRRLSSCQDGRRPAAGIPRGEMVGTSPELSHVKDAVMSKGTVKPHRNTDSYEQSYHKKPIEIQAVHNYIILAISAVPAK
jgi:hypothetical protein